MVLGFSRLPIFVADLAYPGGQVEGGGGCWVMADISHPPMEQLQDLEYCIDSNPPWAETIVLAFQNYILMLGTTVMIPSALVPLMGGSDGDKVRVIQTLLFVSGINTLLQALFGTRLPTVIGGSFTYVIPILYIIHDSSLQQIPDPQERFVRTMRAIQGALIVASSLQIMLGYSQFFSPLGMAPVLGLVGLGLFERGFPAETVWKSGFQCSYCSLGYRRFKFPYPLQWGAPTFDAGHSVAMMAAVLVSIIESTGAYIAASRLAIATPPPAYVLSRGIGWQGIGTLLDGLFGTATGSSVSVENVGLLGLTRVGSRRVVQVSAAFMIFFSTLGKFGAVFASIPFPIFAALYCVLFGLVASVGISFLQFTNMNSMRNLMITGLSLFLGISVPQFFSDTMVTSAHGPVHTRAGWFNAFLNTIFMSSPTVGLIVSVFLDNTLDVAKSKKDRGMPWWVKFRTFRGDNRNEEFYTLPFNLNRFFPPA
uniref:Nucleobase-ascorbate transporter 1 n=1 Tax=Ananas comosus var. bracteatus TaxID=296719 RepID=A0A6V7Q9E3_ANACO|nr:unnamed protein product [Ananas comosus var. bracteatus]